jgi:four helix bundle protein
MNGLRNMSDESKTADLRTRTKQFALRIIRVYKALPADTLGQVLGQAILRSGLAIGAHYRQAQRTREPAVFVSKVEAAIQELEETVYWIELLIDASLVSAAKLAKLHQEAEELIVLLAASLKTARPSPGSSV